MGMKALEDLREMLCGELDEIAKKQEMSAGDLEAVHKLTDTIKNIDKICMLEEGGYSGAGDWEADMRGTYGRGGSYDGGSSYANRGKHYVRGHYSRNDGRGYGRGGYSRDDGKDRMIEEMEGLMDSAGSEKEREIMRRAIEQLRGV